MTIDRIIIEGQTVRRVREQLISEASIDDFTAQLTTYLPLHFPILPSVGATRAMRYDPNTKEGALLVELPPGYRNLQVVHRSEAYPEDAGRRDADGVSRFRVLMPYTYFFFSFTVGSESPDQLANFSINGAAVYWRQEPYRSADDPLFIAAIPNLDGGGGICWGSTVTPRDNFSEHIDALINEYFSTQFNEDLGHRTPFDTSLTQWEQNSENPLDFLNWDYWNNVSSMTFQQLCESYAGGDAVYSVADLGTTFVSLPPMPENFTVARAIEYLQGLDGGARQRLLHAMQQLAEEQPVTEEEAVPA